MIDPQQIWHSAGDCECRRSHTCSHRPHRLRVDRLERPVLTRREHGIRWRAAAHSLHEELRIPPCVEAVGMQAQRQIQVQQASWRMDFGQRDRAAGPESATAHRDGIVRRYDHRRRLFVGQLVPAHAQPIRTCPKACVFSSLRIVCEEPVEILSTLVACLIEEQCCQCFQNSTLLVALFRDSRQASIESRVRIPPGVALPAKQKTPAPLPDRRRTRSRTVG